MDFSKICSSHAVLENTYWKVSDEKILSWLSEKFDKLKEKLRSINYKEKSEVSTFVLSVIEENIESIYYFF